MKSYTDINQSRKLAEFLPLESADMFLALNGTLPVMSKYIDNGLVTADDTAIPCWSLTALLDVLPDEISTGEGYQNKYEIDIRRYYGGNNITLYQIAYGNNKGSSGSWHDIISTSEQEKFVDVCYEMICWLKENGKI